MIAECTSCIRNLNCCPHSHLCHPIRLCTKIIYQPHLLRYNYGRCRDDHLLQATCRGWRLRFRTTSWSAWTTRMHPLQNPQFCYTALRSLGKGSLRKLISLICRTLSSFRSARIIPPNGSVRCMDVWPTRFSFELWHREVWHCFRLTFYWKAFIWLFQIYWLTKLETYKKSMPTTARLRTPTSICSCVKQTYFDCFRNA